MFWTAAFLWNTVIGSGRRFAHYRQLPQMEDKVEGVTKSLSFFRQPKLFPIPRCPRSNFSASPLEQAVIFRIILDLFSTRRERFVVTTIESISFYFEIADSASKNHFGKVLSFYDSPMLLNYTRSKIYFKKQFSK